MKKLRYKLTARRGFSLTELLVVLAIMSLVAAAIGIGITSAAQSYFDIRASSEAAVLSGTLATELSDTLRNATAIAGDGSFTSSRYGAGVSVSTADGHVLIGGREILSEAAYTGLLADAAVTYDGSRFNVKIEVFRDTQRLLEVDFVIKPLNP